MRKLVSRCPRGSRSGADVGREVLAVRVERAATTSAGLPSKTIRPPSCVRAPGPHVDLQRHLTYPCPEAPRYGVPPVDSLRTAHWLAASAEEYL
jgi:hypothetical protein